MDTLDRNLLTAADVSRERVPREVLIRHTPVQRYFTAGNFLFFPFLFCEKQQALILKNERTYVGAFGVQ